MRKQVEGTRGAQKIVAAATALDKKQRENARSKIAALGCIMKALAESVMSLLQRGKSLKKTGGES